MRHTIAEDDFELLGKVSRQGITHLNRCAQLRRPLSKHCPEILPRVLSPREKKRHPSPLFRRNDARCENPCPLRQFLLLFQRLSLYFLIHRRLFLRSFSSPPRSSSSCHRCGARRLAPLL